MEGEMEISVCMLRHSNLRKLLQKFLQNQSYVISKDIKILDISLNDTEYF